MRDIELDNKRSKKHRKKKRKSGGRDKEARGSESKYRNPLQEMPSLWKHDPTVIAIVVGDVHASEKPPICRDIMPSWQAVMRWHFLQIAEIADKSQALVIYVGDIFDRWNASPSIINFLLANLPNGVGIPGNHDLPNHSYNDKERSAYWTLVEAEKIYNLDPGVYYLHRVGKIGLAVYGWPYGIAVKPPSLLKEDSKDLIKLAVVHHYIWTKETGHKGASETDRLKSWRDKLKGYDLAVFGDNHKGFLSTKNGIPILNTGILIRRKSDEIDYQPSIGLIHKDGTITRHFLDTSCDKFLDSEKVFKKLDTEFDLSSLLSELASIGEGGINYEEAVLRWIRDNDIQGIVKDKIIEHLERVKK